MEKTPRIMVRPRTATVTSVAKPKEKSEVKKASVNKVLAIKTRERTLHLYKMVKVYNMVKEVNG